MPRALRVQVPGGIYHVTASSVSSRALCYDNNARALLLRLVAATTARYSLCVLSYCVLATHFHLLVQIDEPDLSRAMQWLNERYGAAINAIEGDRGHVFGARFGSVAVESDPHLLTELRYIARNPVAAGLAKHPLDWQWSAYRFLIRPIQPPAFLSVGPLLRMIDADPQRARRKLRAFVEDEMPTRLASLAMSGV